MIPLLGIQLSFVCKLQLTEGAIYRRNQSLRRKSLDKTLPSVSCKKIFVAILLMTLKVLLFVRCIYTLTLQFDLDIGSVTVFVVFWFHLVLLYVV